MFYILYSLMLYDILFVRTSFLSRYPRKSIGKKIDIRKKSDYNIFVENCRRLSNLAFQKKEKEYEHPENCEISFRQRGIHL